MPKTIFFESNQIMTTCRIQKFSADMTMNELLIHNGINEPITQN